MKNKILPVVCLLITVLFILSCNNDGAGGDSPGATPPENTIAVSAVSLDITSETIVIGRNLQLAASVEPSNATDPSVSWSSGNTSVATVSAGGLVTGVSEGSAVITASADGGSKTAQCTVNVRPLQWGTETMMSVDGGTTSQFPKIKLNSAGFGLAVWQQYNGTATEAYACIFDPESGWQEVKVLDPDTGNSSIQTASVNGNSDAVVFWTEVDGSRYLRSSFYHKASGWEDPVEVQQNSSYSAVMVDAAMDPEGNILAVWVQSDGSRNNIWSNYYSVDTGWETAEIIANITTGYATDCHVCIDDNGDGLAVWEQYNGSRRDIYGNRFEKASGWTGADVIETSTNNATVPRLAMNGSGDATAVWMQQDNRRNIYANRFEPSTGWGTAEVIEEDDGAPANPEVAMNADGTAVAVWPGDIIDDCNIYYNIYIPGTGWGPYDLIRTDETGVARSPKVVLDDSGNAVAVWTQRWDSGTCYRAFSARYEAGTGWDGGGFIEDVQANNSDNISVAVDGFGNAIAVWEDKVDYRIFSNRLE